MKQYIQRIRENKNIYKISGSVFALTLVLFSYQNCVSAKKETITKEALISPPMNVEVDVASIIDCENGGLTLVNYIDHNLNGMRDDEEEIKSTRNVCNGSDGKNGTNGVGAGIVVKPAVTSACPAGGINVTSFVDTNNNGSLDTNESVTSMSTVCNGVDGNDGESSQITATKATPTQCSNGGVVYTTSSDFSDPVSTVICNGTDGSNGINSYITQTVASANQCPTGGTVITTAIDNSEPVFSIICNGANGLNGKDGQSAYITTTIASPFQCPNGGVVISTWTDATNPSNEVICNGTNGTNGTNANVTTKTASADQCANGGVVVTTTDSSNSGQNIICNGAKGDKGEKGDQGNTNTTPTFVTGYVGPLVVNKNYSACHHDFIYFPATGSASNGWLLFRHQKNGSEDQGIGTTGFNVWNVDIANFSLVSEVNNVAYCNLTYDPKALTLKYTVIDKTDGLSGKSGTINLK